MLQTLKCSRIETEHQEESTQKVDRESNYNKDK